MTKLKTLNNLIGEMPLYFSYKEVKNAFRKKKVTITDSTLQTYLSRDVSAGLISSAGKGWYSKIKQLFILDTSPLKQLFVVMKQAFPLLEYSCWSTEQINPFTHHMLGKHILFVFVDSEAISSVHEILLDNGYTSYANPGKPEIEKLFRITDKTAIIRPSVVKQPESIKGASPIEKILVDLLFENRKLNIMQPSEVNLVMENALKSGGINIASMISYGKHRKINIAEAIKDFRIIKKSGDA